MENSTSHPTDIDLLISYGLKLRQDKNNFYSKPLEIVREDIENSLKLFGSLSRQDFLTCFPQLQKACDYYIIAYPTEKEKTERAVSAFSEVLIIINQLYSFIEEKLCMLEHNEVLIDDLLTNEKS